MEYKTLYRKYRPQKFADIIGQENIVTTLQNAINHSKISHAYLFAGPRGTGKTSTAHVFAHTINNNKNAFNSVDSQLDILENMNNLDIIEIDAASNNGVDEIRKIINNTQYVASNSKYKIYIIDEVHMLTKGAFNSFLKTLEEPPQNIVFILATTQPYKIPMTILSRVQRFNFKRIEESEIIKHLQNILKKENIIFENKSLEFIAKLAQGGMRDALSITDQILAFEPAKITYQNVFKIFGIISIENQIKLLNLAYEGNTLQIIKLINVFLTNGLDIERLTISFLDVIKDYIIFQQTHNYQILSFLSKENINFLNLDLEYAYKTINIFLSLITNLKFAAFPKQLFELSMLKLVHLNNQKKPSFQNKQNISSEASVLKLLKQKEEKEKLEKEKNLWPTGKMFIGNPQYQKILKSFDSPLETTKKNKLSNSENSIVTSSKSATNNLKTYSLDFLINLLLNANKEKIFEIKNKWKEIQLYKYDSQFKDIAQLLENTKIISAGNDFVLISSFEDYEIDGIRLANQNTDFMAFVNKILGKNYHIFSLKKRDFQILKKEYQKKQKNNDLPTAKPILYSVLDETQKNESPAQKYGFKIFGKKLNF